MSIDSDTLTTLTADIAAAYVTHNSIAAAEVPTLITNIHGALSGVLMAPAEEEKPEPAVSIRASVKPDHVTCLCCGRQMKMLKRHLMTDHGLTADAYRQMFDLPASHPLVAPNYAAKRADLAKEIGLGTKRNRGRK